MFHFCPGLLDSRPREGERSTKKGIETGEGGRGGVDKNESCWQEKRGKQLRAF